MTPTDQSLPPSARQGHTPTDKRSPAEKAATNIVMKFVGFPSLSAHETVTGMIDAEFAALLAENTRLRAELAELREALRIIDEFGAMWIEAHADESEDGSRPEDNNPDQWCIGGNFYDAERHTLTEAALAFAAWHAQITPKPTPSGSGAA